MKLTMFSLVGLRQLALMSALLGCISFTPAIAVELVGKPVDINTPSASQTVGMPESTEPAPVDIHSDLKKNDINPRSPNNNPPEHPFVAEWDNHLDPDTIIPLVAICFGIGGPVILIIALMGMHYRAKDRREKNINANIERLLAAGRDIPIELLRGDEPQVGNESSLSRDDIHLHKGIKNICLGLGLFVCLTIIFGIRFGAIGFIVLSVGASQLWLWKLSGTKKDNARNQG